MVRASYQAVLYRIIVYVVTHPFELILVADGSLPEAPVPYPAFCVLPPGTTRVCLGSAGMKE